MYWEHVIMCICNQGDCYGAIVAIIMWNLIVGTVGKERLFIEYNQTVQLLAFPSCDCRLSAIIWWSRWIKRLTGYDDPSINQF